MSEHFYLGPGNTGVTGDLALAMRSGGAPEHSTSDYKLVSKDEYENTVLDYRYEDGEWQQ